MLCDVLDVTVVWEMLIISSLLILLMSLVWMNYYFMGQLLGKKSSPSTIDQLIAFYKYMVL